MDRATAAVLLFLGEDHNPEPTQFGNSGRRRPRFAYGDFKF